MQLFNFQWLVGVTREPRDCEFIFVVLLGGDSVRFVAGDQRRQRSGPAERGKKLFLDPIVVLPKPRTLQLQILTCRFDFRR
jgi:hypothetical protein